MDVVHDVSFVALDSGPSWRTAATMILESMVPDAKLSAPYTSPRTLPVAQSGSALSTAGTAGRSLAKAHPELRFVGLCSSLNRSKTPC